jgi:hypothetical protein
VEVISKVVAILVTAMFHGTPLTSWEFKVHMHKLTEYFLFPYSDLIENNQRYKERKKNVNLIL